MAKEPSKKTTASHAYKETLNLPYTDFPIRPNAKVDDPAMIARWKSEQLYAQTDRAHEGNEIFILHDGPPYANGDIHIGHAYNKIIKDIVAKSRRMQKMFVPVVPGFDCHGLPIELKVAESVDKKEVGTLAFIKACREYASYWIEKQSLSFERLGILMEWDKPYRTMDPEYESATIQAFELLRQKGYITRHNKTVPWCSSCQTVLAQAEIEYQERKDPSIYVAFPVVDAAALGLNASDGPVHVVIWTTTPWTIPLNRAVLAHPEGQYRYLRGSNGVYLVSDAAAQGLAELFGMQLTDQVVSGQKLLQGSLQLQHPLIDTLQVPLIASEDVDLNDGTAFVHCAPGCGPEDYHIGITHGLDIYSPVAPDGTYTQDIIPEQLRSMSVADGQIWVIKELASRSRLVAKKTLRHAYPHCWRCRNGLIFRATKQWFCDLSQHNLKQRVMDALTGVTAFPQASMNRLKATIEGRLEWCLSRQRVWGVPIPALLCQRCDYTYTSQELSQFVSEQVAFDGIEFWHKATVEMLPGAKEPCVECGATQWKKEGDILDVWFDSGISHYAVLQKRPELRFPANMYCEGKDQHRGWFQSSLLTSVIINDCSPFKSLLTHGFAVDKAGHKMSKSRGNVVSPQEMMEKLGTDGLRLWVASIDYTDDAVVSDALLTNVAQVYRKIRNTCRFLLSNLHDFDISTDSVALEQLQPLDQYALAQLQERYTEIVAAYNSNDFTAVSHALGDYCTSDLSSFYLDIIKDRLYCDAKTGLSRRSAQTVCWHVLNTLTRVVAPILSFTAEHVWDHFQPENTESIHLQKFVQPLAVWDEIYRKHHRRETAAGGQTPLSSERWGQWKKLLELRAGALKAIERLRELGTIKHSLEAALTFSFDSSQDTELIRVVRDYFEDMTIDGFGIIPFLKQLCIVSQVHIDTQGARAESQAHVDGIGIFVEQARGEKCPRCWHYTVAQSQDSLCDRCMRIVGKLSN